MQCSTFSSLCIKKKRWILLCWIGITPCLFVLIGIYHLDSQPCRLRVYVSILSLWLCIKIIPVAYLPPQRPFFPLCPLYTPSTNPSETQSAVVPPHTYQSVLSILSFFRFPRSSFVYFDVINSKYNTGYSFVALNCSLCVFLILHFFRLQLPDGAPVKLLCWSWNFAGVLFLFSVFVY